MDKEYKKKEDAKGAPKGRRPRIHKQPSPVVRSNDGSEAFDAPLPPSRKKVIAHPEKADDTSSANRPSRGSNRRGSHTKDKNRPKKHPVPKIKTPPPVPKVYDGTTRLNKYLANAGICSRREADKIIAAGGVSVNGNIITEMGFQVHEGDVVKYGGETLQSERKRYFLLNKPKGFITTVDDPQNRETVMMLIDGACPERIYPVGRLDRNTTGLLLFTNDGDLTKKLTHPSSEIEKTYDVELDKPFASVDMDLLRNTGVELHDGKITPDEVEYVGEGKKEVGITIHSGKNRIVRRIFESLGYEVVKLDRVVFAGLTKKDLPRGRWRFLTKNEVSFLKMLSKPKDKNTL